MNGLFFKDIHTAYIPEILTEIYRDKIYEPFLNGRKDITILDIGANIGLTTYYFAQHARRVISLEPSRQHFEVLREMVYYNSLDDIVTPVNKAIGNTNERRTFYHNKNATMFSLNKAVDDKSSEPEEVEVITLEKLLNSSHIKKVHFLKLDVEGAEAEIIGGSWFQMASEKIESMVFEYHSWCGVNPAQLVNALSDYGFEVKKIPSKAILFGAVKR